MAVILALAAALLLQVPVPGGSAAFAQDGPIRASDARVGRVAHRIAAAAKPWCQAQVPLPGWLLHHLAEYPPSLRGDVAAAYALDRGPGLVAITPDSAAATAGFLPGDTLIAANGVALTTAALPRRESREPGDRIEAQLEAQLSLGPVRFDVLRGGETLHITLAAPLACPARVRIARAASKNAFADGRHATFSERLVNETPDEDELAALVAHELAHNILGHYANRRSGRDRRPVRDQEAEADAFALRLMAAAGYDPRGLLRFLDQVVDWNPIEALGLGSHIGRGKRLAAVREELARMDSAPNLARWRGVDIPLPAPAVRP